MSYSKRSQYVRYLQGKGLEIGGLNSPLPVPGAQVLYSDILTSDEIDMMYPGSKHPDIISDSETFPDIESSTFDFIISNHVLEHVTDPIKALEEWCRILKPEGILFMAIPDKRFTFDRDRRRTTLAHLIYDHRNQLDKRDLNFEHLKDWATNVEKIDPASAEWQRWVNYEYQKGYSVHNHVWQIEDIFEVLLYLTNQQIACFELVAHNDTPSQDLEFIIILRKKENVSSQEQKEIKEKLSYLKNRYSLIHQLQIPVRFATHLKDRLKQRLKRMLLSR